MAAAEAGMKQTSDVFRETGSELYMGAGSREIETYRRMRPKRTGLAPFPW